MAMSRQSLVDRAYLRAPLPTIKYDSLVPQAMTLLAREVAADPLLQDSLSKDFSLTITGGAASLTSALTATEPMLIQFLPQAQITSSDSVLPWQFIPDLSQLDLDRPDLGLVYFTITGSNLLASVSSTTATANASFVPLPATLSGNLDLEERAIRTLVALGTGVPTDGGNT